MEKIDLEQIEGTEGLGFPLSNLNTTNKTSLVAAINEANGYSKFFSLTQINRGYTELFSGDFLTLPNGNYVQAVGASSTNVPTTIGNPRSLISFGARTIGDASLQSDILVGSTGLAFKNRTNNIWRVVWTDTNFNPATKVDVSELNTRLANYVPISGAVTIQGTKTFTSSPIIPNATLNSHAVNLGQLNQKITAYDSAIGVGFAENDLDYPYILNSNQDFCWLVTGEKLTNSLNQKANTRLDNVPSNLSINEQTEIKNKIGVVGYVLQSSLTAQLSNYVTVNGVQTINNTKTFTSSPIVPNASLNAHAVNLGQMNQAIANASSETNSITQFDLIINSSFQAIINALPSITLQYAKGYIRNRTLGISIGLKNSSNNDVALFGESSSIVDMFTLPNSVVNLINTEIKSLIPQFKLASTSPVSSITSYQSFVELTGRIKHPYGLMLDKNYTTVLHGEFECLNN